MPSVCIWFKKAAGVKCYTVYLYCHKTVWSDPCFFGGHLIDIILSISFFLLVAKSLPMYDVINYILFNFNKRLFSYHFLFNVLLCIKSEQRVIGNWFRAPIIFKKLLKNGISKRTLLLQFVSGVIFLIRITGFYGLFKVTGIQKYYIIILCTYIMIFFLRFWLEKIQNLSLKYFTFFEQNFRVR